MERSGRKTQDMMTTPSWKSNKKGPPKIGTPGRVCSVISRIYEVIQKNYYDKIYEQITKKKPSVGSDMINSKKTVLLLAFNDQHAQEIARAVAPISNFNIQIRRFSAPEASSHDEVRKAKDLSIKRTSNAESPTEPYLISPISSNEKAPAVITKKYIRKEFHAKGMALETFQLFQKLPSEARQMIWRFACYHPRIVNIQLSRAYGICKSSTPIPGVLQACREAREVTKMIYNPAFQNAWMDAGVYVNFDVDTVEMSYASAQRVNAARDIDVLRAKLLIRFVKITLGCTEMKTMSEELGLLICAAPLRGWSRVGTWTLQLDKSAWDTPISSTSLATQIEIPRPGNMKEALKLSKWVEWHILKFCRLACGATKKGDRMPGAIRFTCSR